MFSENTVDLRVKARIILCSKAALDEVAMCFSLIDVILGSFVGYVLQGREVVK